MKGGTMNNTTERGIPYDFELLNRWYKEMVATQPESEKPPKNSSELKLKKQERQSK